MSQKITDGQEPVKKTSLASAKKPASGPKHVLLKTAIGGSAVLVAVGLFAFGGGLVPATPGTGAAAGTAQPHPLPLPQVATPYQ